MMCSRIAIMTAAMGLTVAAAGIALSPSGPASATGAEPPVIERVAIAAGRLGNVEGRSAPGAHVVLRDNGRLIGHGLADANGFWRIETSRPLEAGDHRISVTARTIGVDRDIGGEEVFIALPSDGGPARAALPRIAGGTTDEQLLRAGTLAEAATRRFDDIMKGVGGADGGARGGVAQPGGQRGVQSGAVADGARLDGQGRTVVADARGTQSSSSGRPAAGSAGPSERDMLDPVWNWLERANRQYQGVIVKQLSEGEAAQGSVAVPSTKSIRTVAAQPIGAQPNLSAGSSASPLSQRMGQLGADPQTNAAPTNSGAAERTGSGSGEKGLLAQTQGLLTGWLDRANRQYQSVVVGRLSDPNPSESAMLSPGSLPTQRAAVADASPMPLAARPKAVEDAARLVEEQRREAEAKRLAEQAAKAKADADSARARAEEDARRIAAAAAEAKAKADADARARAEAEAKTRAEEEARRVAAAAAAKAKADADARARAEEEARRVVAAAADAKAKAEAEAKARAEEEARRVASAAAAAKAKADAEAKTRADEEARRVAAAAAAAKARAEEEARRVAVAAAEKAKVDAAAKARAEAQALRVAEAAEAKAKVEADKRAAADARAAAAAAAVAAAAVSQAEKARQVVAERERAKEKRVADAAKAVADRQAAEAAKIAKATEAQERRAADQARRLAAAAEARAAAAAAKAAKAWAAAVAEASAERTPKTGSRVSRAATKRTVQVAASKSSVSNEHSRGAVAYAPQRLKHAKRAVKHVCSGVCRQLAGKPVKPGAWYVVKRGDSLWHIARMHYNNGNRYRFLRKVNRSQLGMSNVIYPGQRLFIARLRG